MTRACLLTALVAVGIATAAAPTQQAADGKAAFGVCEACHGTQAQGNRSLDAPRIAGLEDWYFKRQIDNYRRGLRGAHPDDVLGRQMSDMARLVTSDAVIADIAAFLAVQSPPPAASTLAADRNRGRQLYGTCAACHGEAATGNAGLAAPALRGRDDWYLLRQLRNFRQGLRGVADDDLPGARMRAIALTLPDEQALRDVIAYAIAPDPAQPTTWTLSDRCPPGFERMGFERMGFQGTADGICEFRSLYQLYTSPRGHGGQRAQLPPMREAFSAQQTDLGRYLFFDPLLSADRTLSCAHCHHPDFGFADGRVRSMGLGARGIGPQRTGGQLLRRNAPTLWNSGFLARLLWDGSATSLAEQALTPLFAANEMANTPQALEAALNGNETYRQLFATAFRRDAQTRISVTEIARALAAFETSLVSFNSRYDRYAHGDDHALTAQELQGYAVFRGFVARCSQCHIPPLFTDAELAVVGAPPADDGTYDPGAGARNASPEMRGAFKVPTLRNVALTAPYFQAGQLATLRDVIDFYNDARGHAVPAGVDARIHWHIAMTKPMLAAADADALAAFLGTLTDESMRPAVPQRIPSGLAVVPARTAAGSFSALHR